MKFNVNNFLAQGHAAYAQQMIARGYPRALLRSVSPMVNKHVVCADGFSVSIQASHSHYCEPRQDEGPWIEVELGFPNMPVPSLDRWADGDPETADVYAWVPVGVVEELIASHGGAV